MDQHNTITDIAPLPQLGHPANMRIKAPAAESKNAWEQMVSYAPIHAEKVHYNATIQVGLPKAERSPLRSGEMTISEQGIAITGIEVQPLKALKAIGSFAFISYIIIRALLIYLATKYPALSSRGIYVWGVYIIVVTAAGIINERKRGATGFTLPWDAVYGAQIEKNLQWMALVYAAPDPNKANQFKNYYLPLNRLDAATMTGIADTILHYAPNAVCVKVPRYEWSLGRKLLWGFFVLVILGMIGAIWWAALQIPAPTP